MRRSAVCSAMLLLVLVLITTTPMSVPQAAAAPDEAPAAATLQTASYVQVAAGGTHTRSTAPPHQVSGVKMRRREISPVNSIASAR